MNGHDFTREQNMEARIRLAAARRELADAVNDATTGIGCLTCDDPQTMNHIRACWKRIYDRYLETDSLIADLAACARNITDGGEWKLELRNDGLFTITDPDGKPHTGEGWSTAADGSVHCGPTDIYFAPFAFNGGCSRWKISGNTCTPLERA